MESPLTAYIIRLLWLWPVTTGYDDDDAQYPVSIGCRVLDYEIMNIHTQELCLLRDETRILFVWLSLLSPTELYSLPTIRSEVLRRGRSLASSVGGSKIELTFHIITQVSDQKASKHKLCYLTDWQIQERPHLNILIEIGNGSCEQQYRVVLV